VGLLDQDRERDRYRLGLKLFELGNVVLANMDLHREARPYVDSLARLSGHLVHLAVFDGRQAVVIHRAEANQEGGPTAFIETSPAYCTSVGKAILAFQSDEVVDRLIAAGLVRFTENTIIDAAALREHLRKVREHGYAVDDAEHQPGLRCVGAPIRDQSGRVFAAISVSAPAFKFPADAIEPMSSIVLHSAQAISRALGWRPGA
jgi:DNA-binding IclR family transcriptional regulator